MPPVADNLKGIAMMLLAGLTYIVNDTLIKLASARLPTGEIILIRGNFGVVFILGLVLATGAWRQLRWLRNGKVVLRSFGEVAATILYLIALFNMPIADISATYQIVPLMTTAAAAIFLGERVGWRRWIAIAVGFVGVVIIMRPGGSGFDAFFIVAFGSMAFITLRDLVTRRLAPEVPTLDVVTGAAIGVWLLGLGLSLRETWVPPTAHEWTLLTAAAVLLLAGHGFMVLAMRHGAVAVVAPFRYAVVVYAILIGYFVWGDIPDAYMLVGTAIVVITGVYSFHREHRVAATARTDEAREEALTDPVL
ncbi:MAG: DMT family transporter [Rhizobiales bacterium]|nr:DMT family transporter [Hyphomicrobiales bacterium]